jgi:CheY-like chemotaxis protein
MHRPAKVSLMIVEDDANIRFLMETSARRSGLFEPICAAVDGQEALEHLRARDTSTLPALIVTDLSMPRLTGLDLVRAIKSDERLRNIPVAVITSSNIPNDRDLALAAGAFSFVHKPYGVDALTQVLTSMCESCGEAARTATPA